MLIGRTDSPSPVLSVLATTLVAPGSFPCSVGSNELSLAASRRRTTSSRASPNVGDGADIQYLPAHMSRLLAQGTGAQWAQVGFAADRLTIAGRWPVDAPDEGPPPVPGKPGATAAGADGVRTSDVRYGDQVLGVSGSRSGPGYRSQRWRSGCSLTSRRRPVWC